MNFDSAQEEPDEKEENSPQKEPEEQNKQVLE